MASCILVEPCYSILPRSSHKRSAFSYQPTAPNRNETTVFKSKVAGMPVSWGHPGRSFGPDLDDMRRCDQARPRWIGADCQNGTTAPERSCFLSNAAIESRLHQGYISYGLCLIFIRHGVLLSA